jgi:hypothetical protein
MRRHIVFSIINYRTADLTVNCIDSVLQEVSGTDGQIVVVDNASGDGSDDVIAEWIADRGVQSVVDLVRSPTNTGFSGGHNLGMAAHDADLYVILNSDAVLRPGFVRHFLDVFAAHPDAGFLVPRLEGQDGTKQTNCFRFPGPFSEFIRGASSGPVTRLLKRYEVSLGPEPDPAAIEWASFACIGLNGRMVRDLGPMDEGYFLYFEDAEYCLRARREGRWPLLRVPEAVAVHFRGGSSPVKSLAQAYKRLPAYYYSSRTRFIYQAHGASGLWMANAMWHMGRSLAQLRRLVGKPVYPRAEGEIWDIWTNIRQPLGPRRAPGE